MSDVGSISDSVGQFLDEMVPVLRQVLRDSQAIIGGIATARYMRTGGTNVPVANPQTGAGSLRRVSGRLSRSLTGARSAQTTGGSIRGAPENISEIDVTAQGVRLKFGSSVEYAAIHEYGGTIEHPGGTPYVVWPDNDQRPFEGAVRFLQKDGDYPEGVQFTDPHDIRIPARPYLRPALDDALPEIKDMTEEKLIDALQERL